MAPTATREGRRRAKGMERRWELKGGGAAACTISSGVSEDMFILRICVVPYSRWDASLELEMELELELFYLPRWVREAREVRTEGTYLPVQATTSKGVCSCLHANIFPPTLSTNPRQSVPHNRAHKKNPPLVNDCTTPKKPVSQ